MSNELTTQTANPLELLQSAIANGVDPGALEKLMDLAERHDKSVAQKAFAAAMTMAQSQCGRVAADSENKQTHSKYASYAALDKVLRPIYTDNCFALSFNTMESAQESHITILCDVSHTAGHTKQYSISMPADGKGAKGGDVMTKTHAVGSATQYGMRYLLKMIFNVAIGDDDDDGNNASGRNIAQELLDYNELVREHWDSITDCKRNLIAMHGELENQVNVTEARAALAEIPEDERKAIWRAPSKGGILTTRERALLKEKPEDAL